MTEAEWNACTDLQRMLKFLRGKASDRKLRLSACACCRHVLETRPRTDNDLRSALATAEELADGLVNQQEGLRVRSQLEAVSPYSDKWSAFSAVSATLDKEPWLAAESAARHAVDHFGTSRREHTSFLVRMLRLGRGEPSKRCYQPAPVLRDVVGNPFHPVAVTSRWLRPTVTDLARSLYQQREFGRLPILAIALQDAGCDNAEILNHCRQPGEHVRGCWVVDLLLGRT